MNAVARMDELMVRKPPCSIEAEQAVLGMLMLDPAALPKISDWLSAEDFYRADHRLIFKAIDGLVKRGSPCDPITLGDWLEANGLDQSLDNVSYIVDLANGTHSAANIVAHAEIVVEKSRLRAAIDVGTRITEQAWAPGADSQQILGTAAHELSIMQASKLRGALEPVKAAMGRMHRELMERYRRGPALLGMPWPWKDLNDRTKGLRDGVLYVVGARPSMGKSVFSLQTAIFLALRGERTAVFSVEMTSEECMARGVACVGQIPHEWVENPAKEDRDAELNWSRLTDATAKIIESPLLIDETPSINIDQLMARARRAHMQKALRLIVIDHMHDMALDPKREVRHEYGRIAQGAKTLAKELNCPVILLAQLNRASDGTRPSLKALRESGEIEQKADVVLFLHREEESNPDTHLKGVVEVIVGKGRNIRKGEPILLQNTFSEMRLQDWIGPIPIAPELEKKSRGMR